MTKGSEPLLYEAPTITIVGKEYTMRRLGIFDVAKLARILSKTSADVIGKLSDTVLARMKVRPEEDGKPGEELGLAAVQDSEWFVAIARAMPNIAEEVIEFLCDLIGFEGDFRDPDQFPLGSEIEILGALIKHVDVKAFFTSVTNLMGKDLAKTMKGIFSEDKSTSSRKHTGGRTKKS